jgi:Lar family restriction alleviation protein
MAATLKPCPFCSAELNVTVEEVSTAVWAVVCNNCGVTGPMPVHPHDSRTSQSFDEAVRAWNQRWTHA